MNTRNLVLSLGVASALAAGASFAQTTIVIDPSPPADRTAPVVIHTPTNTYVVTPDGNPTGQAYAVDQYGRAIIVDDSYVTQAPERRNIFDSSVDYATGTVTLPGYMGPRDASGQ